MRAVVTEAAEQANARVMSTLALSRNNSSTSSFLGGRMAPSGGVLLADPRHSMVLPHIVAIAEEFSRRTLVNASLPQLDLTRAMQRDLWIGAASKAEGTWGGHKKAWWTWHGVQLSDAPDFPALDAFVDARNAIMHGLGKLTRLQTQKDGGEAVSKKLATVGIPVSGLRLVISPTVLEACATTATGFIRWLDGEAVARNLV